MSVPLSAIVNLAHHELGQPGGENTCVKGIQRWVRRAGLPFPDTLSVSEFRELAKKGIDGWRYHEGMGGIRVGYVLDWKDIAHVSIVDAIDWQGNIRSIGSGGPTGKVAYQPRGGGYNAQSVFRGYFIPPTGKPVTPKPAKDFSPLTYSVKSGDTLDTIAHEHGTSWQHLAAVNHITDPDHIEVGWRLRLK